MGMGKGMQKAKRELWWFTENMLVKLPVVEVSGRGKIGPALALGGGCGLGLGAGVLVAGTGLYFGIPSTPIKVGVGAGCGLGVGIGYGIGMGWAKDESVEYSNIDKFIRRHRDSSNRERIKVGLDSAIDDLITSTRRACDAIAKEIEKRAGGL